ncbi:hypothetical protein M885DRAFT_622558 [Pelagophyceae sp. CCMP2097]|nr:hypothetical protein M885DRAFT_622558 [Pelagophyceae sp. CCMP2097]
MRAALWAVLACAARLQDIGVAAGSRRGAQRLTVPRGRSKGALPIGARGGWGGDGKRATASAPPGAVAEARRVLAVARRAVAEAKAAAAVRTEWYAASARRRAIHFALRLKRLRVACAEYAHAVRDGAVLRLRAFVVAARAVRDGAALRLRAFVVAARALRDGAAARASSLGSAARRRASGGAWTPAQRRALAALRAEVDAPTHRAAARAGMPLTDATLARYLACAGWAPRFRDRSVAAAVADTVAWRGRAPEVRRRGKRRGTLATACWRTRAVTARGEAVVVVRCSAIRGGDANAWREHLVRTVEEALGGRAQAVLVVVDCRGASSRRLLDAARAASPAFPVLATHYPGRLGGVAVVGCGAAGHACWWVVRAVLDEPTRAKIAFYDDVRDVPIKGLDAELRADR